MLKQYIETGEVVGTHGVRGELRVMPWCDSPEFLTRIKTLYLDCSGSCKLQILSARVHKSLVLIKVKNIDSIEQAETLRGKIVYIFRGDIELSDGKYFIQDLMDSEVYDCDSGQFLGTLCDVSKTGANDVWHVKKENQEYLVPAIPEVIVDVDLQNNRLSIRPLKGIFDDED